MPKLSAKHKIMMAFTMLLWAIWLIFAIVKTDTIKGNDRVQSLFGIMASLMIIIYIGLYAAILYPDISYTSKKINDNNRDRVYYIRRSMFCFLQMIYVFFLGGMSISIYYEGWRLGFSIVAPIFMILFALGVIVYAIKMIPCLKIAPPPESKVLPPEVIVPVYSSKAEENAEKEETEITITDNTDTDNLNNEETPKDNN